MGTQKPARAKVIVIVGPTASGKTVLGIEVAKKVNGAIISADSRQVFAGMNSGSAKPKEAWLDKAHDILTSDEVSGVPHYLLSIKQPTEEYSLAQWQQDAFAVADKIIAEGKTPIVVGGTMLYIDSFVYNYSLPNVAPNPALREELEALPATELYDRLLKQDPEAKTFIESSNKRRIIRALEVITATGKPFSAQRQRRSPRYNIIFIGLLPSQHPLDKGDIGGLLDWTQLKENITNRAEAMMKEGLVSETKKLAAKYGADLPLLQTLNYRQALAIIQGKTTEAEALTGMVQDTNRYARRQMSWWKNNKDIIWFSDIESAIKSKALM